MWQCQRKTLRGGWREKRGGEDEKRRKEDCD